MDSETPWPYLKLQGEGPSLNLAELQGCLLRMKITFGFERDVLSTHFLYLQY